MNKLLDGPTPMTDAATVLTCPSAHFPEGEGDPMVPVEVASNLERIAAEAVDALKLIMHARRNPNAALTDMSRAGMRELAGEALSRIKAAGWDAQEQKRD